MTKEKTVDDLLHFMRQVENPYWMIDIVERMRWIPVEERLPEAFENVIICRKDGSVEQGMRNVNGWWKVRGTNIKSVVAWMPLPKPYRPEE